MEIHDEVLNQGYGILTVSSDDSIVSYLKGKIGGLEKTLSVEQGITLTSETVRFS